MISVSNKTIPVTLTPKAVDQVKAIMENKNISPEEYGLRIGVKGGGCSGTSFLLGFNTVKTGDETYFLENIAVYIEKKHIMYLIGLQIDFEESENGTGFVFNNPATDPA